MKLVLTAAAMLGLALAARAEDPFVDLPFDEALARAGREKKIVMVDFFTTWCPPCKKLDQTTWKDDGVRAWLAEHTLALKIDAEQEAELAKRYGIGAYPTMLFVRPDGSELDRIVGYKEAAAFLDDARLIASGAHLIDRDREQLAGKEDDPEVRMQLANACEQRGLLEEALEHYLWCWDHGLEHQPAFSGVRGSFLVGYIARLGRRHPPALEALRTRRGAAADALLATSDSRSAFSLAMDVIALDRELGQQRETLAVYDRLKAARGDLPELEELVRSLFLDAVGELLLEDRRYEDLRAAFGGDAAGWVTKNLDRSRELDGVLAGLDQGESDELGALRRSFAIAKLGLAVEFLVATEEPDRASEVVASILDYDASSATFYTLAKRVAQPGGAAAKAVLERLVARAGEALEPKELDRLRVKIERLERRSAQRAEDAR